MQKACDVQSSPRDESVRLADRTGINATVTDRRYNAVEENAATKR